MGSQAFSPSPATAMHAVLSLLHSVCVSQGMKDEHSSPPPPPTSTHAPSWHAICVSPPHPLRTGSHSRGPGPGIVAQDSSKQIVCSRTCLHHPHHSELGSPGKQRSGSHTPGPVFVSRPPTKQIPSIHTPPALHCIQSSPRISQVCGCLLVNLQSVSSVHALELPFPVAPLLLDEFALLLPGPPPPLLL